MPKTKITPRKPGFLCSICLVRLPSKEEWSDHLLACGMADINKRKFECDVCDQAFSKKIVLVRHMKRIHPIPEVPRNADPATESSKESVDPLEDWQEDPGDFIFEESETGLEEGRIRRKRTSPCLPGVRRKVKSIKSMDDPASEDFGKNDCGVAPEVVESPVGSQHCSCCSHRVLKSDIGTQTDVTTNETKGKSHQKIIRVTRKYQKDGETIEKFEEDVWHDFV